MRQFQSDLVAVVVVLVVLSSTKVNKFYGGASWDTWESCTEQNRQSIIFEAKMLKEEKEKIRQMSSINASIDTMVIAHTAAAAITRHQPRNLHIRHNRGPCANVRAYACVRVCICRRRRMQTLSVSISLSLLFRVVSFLFYSILKCSNSKPTK